MKSNNLLLTGSTGFIGSNFLNNIEEKFENIYLVTKEEIKEDNSHYIKWNFKNPYGDIILPSDIDTIIHLAADNNKMASYKDLFYTNTLSTMRLLEYGKEIGIKSFVYVSSGGIYGYNQTPSKEDNKTNFIDFYGLTKYQSEEITNFYSSYFSTTILRLFFPYGKGQKKGIIPLLTNKIISKEKIITYNDNNPIINPIYITDVIKILFDSLHLKGSHTINIAGDDHISIHDLSELIGNYLDINPIYENIKDKNISNLLGDNAYMKEIFNIRLSINIRKGIENYISG